MNLHEQIDRFSARSPRQKVLAGGVVLAAIVAVLLGVFYLGVSKGDGWADSRYLKDREQRMQQIARFEANEKQFAAENALLKKQNEATAEILKANDAKLAGDAKKFTDLLNERNKRYEEIDVDADFNSQLCGLCSDAVRSGFRLSDATCGRCKAAP